MPRSTAESYRLVRGCCSAALCTAIFLILGVGRAADSAASSSPVLQAMQAELERSMLKLKAQPVPPYFLSYEITESQSVFVGGAFGRLTGSSEYRHRQLDIDLRVGDYSMDNTREIRGGMQQNPYANYANISIPIDKDPDAI